MKKQLLLLFAALLSVMTGVKAQSLTATPDVIDHLDYIGQGPSGMSCYILVGQDLAGEQVIVTAPEHFEISLNGDDFLPSLQIHLVEDSLLVNQTIPIFARLMAGLDEGAYEGTILHIYGDESVEVQVSGNVEVLKAPTVTTLEVTDIGINSAKVGGYVVDDGHSDVTERGICLSTILEPTIDDGTIHCGTGIGVFFADTTGLLANTTYYVRAYAINDSIGIAYGDAVSFTTLEPNIYYVYVDCNIEGLVTVNMVTAHENDTIIISIEENEYYELDTMWVYRIDDPMQTVPKENNAFVMPAYNVMVKAIFVHKQAIIDDIAQPNPICAGEILALEIPNYDFPNDAIDTRWQLSNQEDFDGHIIVYEESQPLDVSFDSWWLRFNVSYEWGDSFGNAVQITVNGMDNLSIIGDTDPCSNQESEYYISGVENYSINWQVSDTAATVMIESDRIKVLWVTAGQHSISASVTNLLTGCSTQVETSVTVISHIEASAIKAIVQKDDYHLVYPNPESYNYKYQWYKNNTLISGATQQYYLDENGLDGTYKVYVSFNGDDEGNLFCGAFSPKIVVNKAILTVPLSIYPNPANVGETIFINNDGNEEAMLTIYALDGRLLHSQTIVGNQASVNLNLSQGIYVACITNKEGCKTEKIVIQ